MEDDRAAGTGPNFGPPFQTSYERELSPEMWLEGAFPEHTLDWFVTVYEDHQVAVHQGKHPLNIYACRWCDALENVRQAMPLRVAALLRYVSWRIFHEGSPK